MNTLSRDTSAKRMGFLRNVAIVSTTSVVASLGAVQEANAKIVFQEKFESSLGQVLNRWSSWESWEAGDNRAESRINKSHTLVDPSFPANGRVMRFYIDTRQGPFDPPKADLVDFGGGSSTGIDPNKEHWIGYRFYLPSSVNVNAKKPQIIYQMHDNSGRPPHTLNIGENGELQYSFSADGEQTSSGSLGKVPRNQWVNVVTHIKPSYDSSGFAKIYINNQLKKTYKGKFSERGVDLRTSRIGFYLSGLKKPDTENNYPGDNYTIYFDNYSRGDANSSFSEVNPAD